VGLDPSRAVSCGLAAPMRLSGEAQHLHC
jgi:hypothetical protein